MAGRPIHTCVGFYPNGDHIVNYVRDEDLGDNLSYNETFRPGRYYFVDGEYACGGIAKGEKKSALIARFEAELESLSIPESLSDSRPYA